MSATPQLSLAELDTVMLVEKVEDLRERRLEDKLRQLRETLEQRRAQVVSA